ESHTTLAAPRAGTVTFLFSDIEGSTRLLRELGTERYGELLGRHNELLRGAIGAHGGGEGGRHGDSFVAVFDEALRAGEGAAAAQRALATEAWPDGVAVRARMGLHTGEARLAPEGYVGLAVHEAARVGDVGHGGQVVISAATAALVEPELPEDVELHD